MLPESSLDERCSQQGLRSCQKETENRVTRKHRVQFETNAHTLKLVYIVLFFFSRLRGAYPVECGPIRKVAGLLMELAVRRNACHVIC